MVNIDRDTPMLLPPDLRQWVPEDDLVHFVIEAVEGMKLSTLKYNRRGTGSEQYPPRMMLALLIYCYANGIFSSRRIERATYRDIAVRYLAGDKHPDHDTICAFRRQNFDLIAEAFLQVLHLARQMKLLKVGTVSVDGTHLQANASKRRSVRYDRLLELDQQLEEEVASLMQRAEQIDSSKQDDGQSLPRQIATRERLREQIAAARAQLERQAKDRAEAERAAYEQKMQQRQDQIDQGRTPRGRRPHPPKNDSPPTPNAKAQCNLTDRDAPMMRKNHHESYQAAYNAQAAVDAEGSMLVLSNHVITTPADFGQLEVAVENIDCSVGEVKSVLADGGYAKHESIEKLEAAGIDVYVAVTHEDNLATRSHDLYSREQRKRRRTPSHPTMRAMHAKVNTPEGRRHYAKRQRSSEPVFGIIKHVMGFRQFNLRGLASVSGEWSLLTLAYNFKRLWNLQTAQLAG